MAISADRLAVALNTISSPADLDRRCEVREQNVRIVEYTPFPRATRDDNPRFGFTRDHSPGGMCIGVDQPESIGTLLRITLRDVAGSSGRPRVARVVWCSRERDGRHWLGLERVCGTESI